MGTVATIIVEDPNSELAQKAVSSAWQEIERLQKVFDFHDQQSELSSLNATAGSAAFPLSKDMFTVIERALWAGGITDGMFDITIGPIVKLYGFYRNSEKRIPSDEEIKNTLKVVDYHLVQISTENQSVRLLKNGVALDLGGLAKGYAVDKAAAVLMSHGIKSGLVNIGGNIYAFGPHEWPIGIQAPRDNKKVLKVIKLKDQGVATSGDYERYFIKNHQRVHHIFDPRTGRSATANIGVTVIARDAFTADIFSTSLFVLDEKRAKVLADSQGVEVFIARPLRPLP
jgi:thiamine biosynthesis lipoprotein